MAETGRSVGHELTNPYAFVRPTPSPKALHTMISGLIPTPEVLADLLDLATPPEKLIAPVALGTVPPEWSNFDTNQRAS